MKSNRERAKRLIIILTIIFVLNIISIISDLMQYTLLSAPDGISIEAIETNNLRQNIIGILTFFCYILSYTFFILWFRRAYYNLHQVVKHLEFDEGWAAGAWFVPFLNLYRPYQIMKEIYIESEVYLKKLNTTYSVRLSTNLIGIWWFLWITASILERIGMKLNLSAVTIEDISNATLLNLINGLFTIPLCLVLLKVIKDYSKVETTLFELENSNGNSEISLESITVMEE